jgi:hypothetical protein
MKTTNSQIITKKLILLINSQFVDIKIINKQVK